MISPIGAATEEGVKTLPDIIRAAAESPLGIFALMIICVSALAFTFFRRANEYVKLGIFFCFFVGIVAFWLSIRNELSPTSPPVTGTSPSPTQMPSERTAFTGTPAASDNPYAFNSDCWDKGNVSNWEASDTQFTIWPTKEEGIAALNCAQTDEAEISVDMKPSGNAWSGGLVFWAEYEKNCYLFLVNSNKNFRISHFINDQWIGDWQVTDKDVINAGGGQVNRLKVILKKGSASAYINDHLFQNLYRTKRFVIGA